MKKPDDEAALTNAPQEPVAIRDFYQHPQQTSPVIFVSETQQKPGDSQEGRSLLWVANLTIEGTCRYSIGGQHVDVSAYHFALMRPRVPVKWEVLSQKQRATKTKSPARDASTPANKGKASNHHTSWKTIYAIFEPRSHWFPWLNYPDTLPGFIVLPLKDAVLQKQIHTAFRAALRTYRKAEPHRDEWTLIHLEEILLRLFIHHEKQHSGVDPRVQVAIEFMRQNYAKPITLRHISQSAHLSVSQLSLLFSQQIGVAPIQFLESVRLSRAVELLRFSSDPVSQIALATGFRDPEYFARRIRIHLGETPREFRRNAQSNFESHEEESGHFPYKLD